jgi:hypothetical protein
MTISYEFALFKLIAAPWISRSIYVFVKLGVADLLSKGEMDYRQIAEIVDAKPEALYRLLQALDLTGLVVEVRPATFALTKLGNALNQALLVG